MEIAASLRVKLWLTGCRSVYDLAILLSAKCLTARRLAMTIVLKFPVDISACVAIERSRLRKVKSKGERPIREKGTASPWTRMSNGKNAKRVKKLYASHKEIPVFSLRGCSNLFTRRGYTSVQRSKGIGI